MRVELWIGRVNSHTRTMCPINFWNVEASVPDGPSAIVLHAYEIADTQRNQLPICLRLEVVRPQKVFPQSLKSARPFIERMEVL